MLPLFYRRSWQVASFFLLFSVLALALVPAIWLWPQSADGFWKLPDKLLHALTFMLLAVWFSGQFQRSSYWRIATGLLVFGALIEACQSMLPYRSAETGDMIADVIGIVCGVIIGLMGVGGWSMRVEGWMRSRFG
jgi:VanZ family protein